VIVNRRRVTKAAIHDWRDSTLPPARFPAVATPGDVVPANSVTLRLSSPQLPDF
jgi:hypothetical protein